MNVLTRHEGIGLMLFSLGYAILGMASMPPGIVPGDGAELIYGLETFQIVHAPGYPLYRLIGWGLNAVSPHSSPMNAHFLSLLFTVLSLVVLYLLLRRLEVSRFASFVSLAVLGFAYPIWTLSVQVEVYSLALFLFAVTLLLAELVRANSTGRRMLWFWAGLSLTHHPIGLLNVGLALYATYRDREPVRVSEVLLFVLPGGLYGTLFLPVSAFPFNWTQIGTVEAFLNHLLGGGMTGFFLESGLWTPVVQFRRLAVAHLAVFPLLVLPVLLVGYLRMTEDLGFPVLLQGSLLLVMLGFEIPDASDFLVPSYFVGALVLGRGVDFFREGSNLLRTTVGVACLLSVLGFGLMVGVEYDRSGYEFPERYAKSAEEEVGVGVVLGDWSHYTLLRYYQLRRDFLSGAQLLTLTPGSDAWGRLVRQHHQDGKTVYSTLGDWKPPSTFELAPVGHLYRVRPASPE